MSNLEKYFWIINIRRSMDEFLTTLQVNDQGN